MKHRIRTLSVLALLVTGFIFTVVFAVRGQDGLVPDGIIGKTYNAAFPVAITLDGDFSDWQNVSEATVVDGPLVPSAPDAKGVMKFAAVADSNNLYFRVDVTDAHIIAGQHGDNYFNEDSVEIYINATGNLALTEYQKGVVQLTIPAVNIGKPLNQSILYGKDWESIGAQAIVVKTDTGYAMEVSVPLQNSLWSITPAQNAVIGFQIQLNGASQQDRDLKLSWSKADTTDQSYINPSLFGQLIFYKADENAVALAATVVPSAGPTAVPHATLIPVGDGFSVRGTKIYGPDGKEFVAKGVNVNGYNWVWTRSTVNDVHLIADCWAFNLVRVNSFLFMGESKYPQYTNNNDLDAIVKTYTQRGIVVVFEGHDRIGSYYQGDDLTALVAWFTDLARKYKDNPYVWFDVANEPGGRKSLDSNLWINMHGQVIKGIRDDAGANNIVIVEGAYGGQDTASDAPTVTDSAILQYGKDVVHFGGRSFQNIVFSIHTYDLWNQGDAKLADYFDKVAELGFPMIIGEYGVRTDRDVMQAAKSTFNVAIPRNIGLIVWQWEGRDDNDLTTGTSEGGGWEINDCANPTNLSWLGEQVWKDNHSTDG
ncbi:MAG: cellulase family glycosylhydrolase [Anaerolineaceae bacterium]|nr:cellulase family glycosylhydrolase [Anaerolineaceae bacterium]